MISIYGLSIGSVLFGKSYLIKYEDITKIRRPLLIFLFVRVFRIRTRDFRVAEKVGFFLMLGIVKCKHVTF